MIRLLAVASVVVLTGWLSLDSLLRRAIYPFDDTRVAPASVGLPRVQEHVLDAGSGQRVVWVAAPKPGNPVIFYLHGNAGNLANRAGRFARFLERGYGLVAPAYPGSSGSAGSPSEETILQSVQSAWMWQVAQRSNPQSVIIYGESLGTAVTLGVLANTLTSAKEFEPAAVVLEAPFTSLKAVATHTYPQLAELADRTPDTWDSLARAKALHAPLLVIHGTEDALIPIEQGRQIFAAAPSDHKTFLAVPGAGHTDLWRTDTLPQLWRFIDRYAAVSNR